MAIFLAKGLAGAGEYVPTTGNLNGIPFGSTYNCAPGGNSLFVDVAPTDSFCRHVHYLAVAERHAWLRQLRILSEPGRHARRDGVLHRQGRSWRREAATPYRSPTADPGPGRSYSCAAGSPNLHFADVPVSNAFCKHIHYLWAKGIVDGCSATKYCPGSPVARDAMAKFIANGFGLQLYGP